MFQISINMDENLVEIHKLLQLKNRKNGIKKLHPNYVISF